MQVCHLRGWSFINNVFIFSLNVLQTYHQPSQMIQARSGLQVIGLIVIKLKLQKDKLGKKRLHRNEVSHSSELCSVLAFVIVRGARSFAVFTFYNNTNISTRHLYFCLWE